MPNKVKQAKRTHDDVDPAGDADEPSGFELKKLLLSLSTKMDTLNNTVGAVDNRLNAKIDKLDSSVSSMIREVKSDMDNRFNTLSIDIDQRLEDAVTSTDRKIDEKTAVLSTEVTRLDEQRALHEWRLDNLERVSRENELIITGVPVEPKDNPFGIVGDICKALQCDLVERDFVTAFRLRGNNSDVNSAARHSAPIMVKVYDVGVKRHLLSAYFKRKNLCLKDIGFQSTARIYVNESLTKSNRAIFNLASAAKKENLIASFFSRSGLVLIKREPNDKPVIIYHISELERILPINFRNSSRPIHHRSSRYRKFKNRPKSTTTSNHIPAAVINDSNTDIHAVVPAVVATDRPTTAYMEISNIAVSTGATVNQDSTFDPNSVPT